MTADFYDYLNIKLQGNNSQDSSSIDTASLETSNSAKSSVFDENKASVKVDGKTIFQTATKEELNNVDYEKILNADNSQEAENNDDVKFSPLEWVLKQLFNLDKDKFIEEADTNNDGEVSVDEARAYVEDLAAKDGDAENLSIEDFQAVIDEYDIDIDDKISTEEILSTATLDNNVYAPVRDIDYTQPAANYSNISYSDYSSNIPHVKKLEDMSLDELSDEKTTRLENLNEKQDALNNVKRENTPTLIAAKENVQKAKEDYEQALENDPVLCFYKEQIVQNNKDIEDLKQNIDTCEINISEKETEISNQEHTCAIAEGNLQALKDALSALPAKSGKPEDADSDAKIEAKIIEIKAKITEQEQVVATEKQKLDDLNTELNDLNTQKETLQRGLDAAESRKEYLDYTVETLGMQITKDALQAYNEAVTSFDNLKATELDNAQKAVEEAKKSVDEVNDLIVKAEAAKVKAENSLTPVMDINNVSSNFISTYGVTEKTLPDGTKVLACRWSRFSKANKEWLDMQKIMLQAAADCGLTLVYSDFERTVHESDIAHEEKGNVVCKGGESPHNYGCAADITLFKNGQVISSKSSEQAHFAARVKELSNGAITWGGDWRKPNEEHHFELTAWKKYKNTSNLVG